MRWIETLSLIAVGGALGAVARFLFSEGVHLFFDRGFPVGILLTNVLGSLAMGFLSIWLFHRFEFVEGLRNLMLIGFLGAFTTFSTFSMDTISLMNSGHWVAAGLNVVLSVVLCLAAAGGGAYLGNMIR